MTVSDLVKAAMRKIGAIASGETPTADEVSDGMSALNLMLASWSNENLLIPTLTREEFALVSGQASRTIGTGGNFNTTRPVEIDRVHVEDANGSEYPIELISIGEYAAIADKALTSELPSKVYYDETAPLGILHFWPVPSSTRNLVIYSAKLIGSYTSSATDVTLPPGYDEAIIYNLAIRLAPEFGKTVTNEIGQIAIESKAQLKRQNTKPEPIGCDIGIAGMGQGFNILSGE